MKEGKAQRGGRCFKVEVEVFRKRKIVIPFGKEDDKREKGGRDLGYLANSRVMQRSRIITYG